MNMTKRANEVIPCSEVVAKALENHEKLVVFVEDVDLAEAQFMKFLADRYETGKFGELSKGEHSVGQAIFVLAKGGSTSYEEKKNQDSVISLNLRINEPMNQSYNFDHKLKHEWDLSSKTKTASARSDHLGSHASLSEMEYPPTTQFPIKRSSFIHVFHSNELNFWELGSHFSLCKGHSGHDGLRGRFMWVEKLGKDVPLSVLQRHKVGFTGCMYSFFGLFSGNVFRNDELGKEIMQIALPSALALTADPIASLIDTAFIGHIGPVELAAVGISIAVFNQVSKVAIFPLVSVTTSFVAEEDATQRLNTEEDDNETGADHNGVIKKDYAVLNQEIEMEELIPQVESMHESYTKTNDRRHNPSASTALIIASLLGLIQALFLIFSAKPILNYMGLDSNSPMLKPAQQYLTLRSLGAPAVLLSLAMQGVFRGFKDTKTPLYATMVGDVANIILDPIFIFMLKMGVSGAAIAHVISQYIIALILMWRLMKEVDLLPPSINDLQFGRFLRNGFMLLVRVIAVTFCVTLAASLAARLGATSMAAFQVCLQIWLATSLLADGLAVAGQAILASSFARKDYDKATATASRILQLGLVLGLVLSVLLVVVLQFTSRLFTTDINVLQLIGLSIPFVAVTQPINALAFVFDGINYGASDFAYSAYSMVKDRNAISLSLMTCYVT
ncbi:hypothetical protein FH972_016849 [Carpinus fangiana]|uniref:Protein DETOXIFICATION n=1 Tax=Carpinus fangiana TaxID=176857 RepID=A0A5N6RIE5_9ROSI|nr:hypothetical protein FH972_016849 [Carpinus fangiana]